MPSSIADVSVDNPLPVSIVGGSEGSSGGLTDTELRAAPVAVSGTVTANVGTVAVTGGFLTDAQLRNSAISVTFSNSSLAVTGPLTDAQLRNSAVPVSAAALPLPTGAATETTLAAISTKTLAAGQATMANSSPVVIASNQSAVPVSGTVTANLGTIAGVSTETTLAALSAKFGALGQAAMAASAPVVIASNQSAIPVSFTQAALPANQTVNLAQLAGTTPDVNSGTKSAGTMRVVLATDQPALTNKLLVTPDSVALPANQSVNVSQMNGVTVTMGSGATGTGVQRVVLATDVALPTGANVIGALTANQSVNNAQFNGVVPLMGNGVTGTGSLRVTIASDNTAFSVNAAQSGTWNIGTVTTLTSITNAVTITPPTLTKGTQGATGLSTQDLKDAGRAIVNAATAIAGITAVTSEALLTLAVSRDGAATSNVTTIAVTSGKRLRIIGVVAGIISTAAAVISARVSLRMNPSGTVTASSTILAILTMSQQAAALAQAGDTCVMMFPEAIEISGTMQVGLSQVASAITGTVWASLIGYEY